MGKGLDVWFSSWDIIIMIWKWFLCSIYQGITVNIPIGNWLCTCVITHCKYYMNVIGSRRRTVVFLLGYVSLQLLVQNRRRKWHFPFNFRNGINWASPIPLNIHNTINWADAFSKAFSSSEALISVLSKNACLYDNISNSFQSKTLYIVLTFKWSRLDTNLWICNLCIYQKTCQQNTNFW